MAILAVIVKSVGVDREGVPYYNDSAPDVDDIEYYVCDICNEQFGVMVWEEANKHYLEEHE